MFSTKIIYKEGVTDVCLFIKIIAFVQRLGNINENYMVIAPKKYLYKYFVCLTIILLFYLLIVLQLQPLQDM